VVPVDDIMTLCNSAQDMVSRHCYRTRWELDPMLHQFITEHRAEIVNRSVEKGGGYLPRT